VASPDDTVFPAASARGGGRALLRSVSPRRGDAAATAATPVGVWSRRPAG